MAASADNRAELRRMTAEPTTATYSDDVLDGYIERYPLIDPDDNLPGSTNWTATYDLNAAAADIWDEKASLLAPNYTFSADGGSFNRSEAYDHATQRARTFRSRRKAKTVRQVSVPQATVPLQEDL